MGTGWSQDEAASQAQASHEDQKNPREPNPSSSVNGNDLAKATPLRGEAEAKPNCVNGMKLKDQPEKRSKAIHNLDAIIANADSPVDRLSPENLTQLRDGVILKQKRQKYWVDKKGKNCFMLYARDLSITWAEDPRYWTWNPACDDESIEVAELVNVCWLEVFGKLDTKNLSPATSYEVSIVLMVKQQAYGWDGAPVNLVLNLPDGSKSQRNIDMMLVQPRDRWTEIPAGLYKTSPENQHGEITFSLYEYHGGKWKSGLVIKGVKIQPA